FFMAWGRAQPVMCAVSARRMFRIRSFTANDSKQAKDPSNGMNNWSRWLGPLRLQPLGYACRQVGVSKNFKHGPATTFGTNGMRKCRRLWGGGGGNFHRGVFV